MYYILLTINKMIYIIYLTHGFVPIFSGDCMSNLAAVPEKEDALGILCSETIDLTYLDEVESKSKEAKNYTVLNVEDVIAVEDFVF